MKKAFRKSLKRQTSLGYFRGSFRSQSKDSNQEVNNTNQNLYLWPALAKKYQFNYPNDWYRIEAHWLGQIESFQEQPVDCPGRDVKMNNAITRISQCNESYQLCNSLPRSFIVPKDLKDVALINTLSTVIKNHRVPIISYCCPIEYRRNFIIRCASSDQLARVVDILNRVVKPLKVMNLTAIAPSVESLEAAHRKLIEVCRPGDDHGLNFISKSGKWLRKVSLALKLVNEAARILLTEASVVLIEDEDRGWNSVISSLIQIILEPHNRTIEGLESLISKEWIYLSGGHPNYSQPDVLFTLFLDCIYQIYIQNVTQFEFTSEYLRYLFEAQYNTTSYSVSERNRNLIINNNNNDIYHYSHHSNGVMTRSKTTTSTSNYNNDEIDDIFQAETASYKPASVSLLDLNLSLNNDGSKNNPEDPIYKLQSGYNYKMFNPFYKPNSDTPIVKVYDYICNIKLWSSLYLRWQSTINYGCIEETFYFQISPPELKIVSKEIAQ